MRHARTAVGGVVALLLTLSSVAGAQDEPATTTTVELSAPSATSLAPPTTAAPSTTVAPSPSDVIDSTTTSVPADAVPTQVAGAQEVNGGRLATTGVEPGLLAGLGLALVVAGSGLVVRTRRD